MSEAQLKQQAFGKAVTRLDVCHTRLTLTGGAFFFHLTLRYNT